MASIATALVVVASLFAVPVQSITHETNVPTECVARVRVQQGSTRRPVITPSCADLKAKFGCATIKVLIDDGKGNELPLSSSQYPDITALQCADIVEEVEGSVLITDAAASSGQPELAGIAMPHLKLVTQSIKISPRWRSNTKACAIGDVSLGGGGDGVLRVGKKIILEASTVSAQGSKQTPCRIGNVTLNNLQHYNYGVAVYVRTSGLGASIGAVQINPDAAPPKLGMSGGTGPPLQVYASDGASVGSIAINGVTDIGGRLDVQNKGSSIQGIAITGHADDAKGIKINNGISIAHTGQSATGPISIAGVGEIGGGTDVNVIDIKAQGAVKNLAGVTLRARKPTPQQLVALGRRANPDGTFGLRGIINVKIGGEDGISCPRGWKSTNQQMRFDEVRGSNVPAINLYGVDPSFVHTESQTAVKFGSTDCDRPACKPTHHFSSPHTISRFDACYPNTKECFADEYAANPATATADLDCRLITLCHSSSEYEVAGPTPTTDRDCARLTTCAQALEFETKAATPTSDRACAQLRNCTLGRDYESAAPTATTDRECASVRDCATPQEHEARPPTLHADRVCHVTATCSPGAEFEAAAPTSTSDRACTQLRNCTAAAEFEAAAPTPTTDRLCQRLRACVVGNEFEQEPPTSTSDRVCSQTQPICAKGMFEAIRPNRTHDRACRQLTECQPGTHITGAPSYFADRQCTPCPSSSTFSADINAERCTPFMECAPGTYEAAAPSASTNRVCSLCPADLGEVDGLGAAAAETCRQHIAGAGAATDGQADAGVIAGVSVSVVALIALAAVGAVFLHQRGQQAGQANGAAPKASMASSTFLTNPNANLNWRNSRGPSLGGRTGTGSSHGGRSTYGVEMAAMSGGAERPTPCQQGPAAATGLSKPMYQSNEPPHSGVTTYSMADDGDGSEPMDNLGSSGNHDGGGAPGLAQAPPGSQRHYEQAATLQRPSRQKHKLLAPARGAYDWEDNSMYDSAGSCHGTPSDPTGGGSNGGNGGEYIDAVGAQDADASAGGDVQNMYAMETTVAHKAVHGRSQSSSES